MNKSAVKSDADNRHCLEFPVAPDYAPTPARVSLDEAARFTEQLRLWFPDAMETEEQRLARKVAVEFVL